MSNENERRLKEARRIALAAEKEARTREKIARQIEHSYRSHRTPQQAWAEEAA